MIQYLIKLPRNIKRALMLLFDVVAIIGSLFAAFSMRLGYWHFPSRDIDFLLIIFLAPILALPIFIRFGLYHDVIRYVGIKSLWRSLKTPYFSVQKGCLPRFPALNILVSIPF